MNARLERILIKLARQYAPHLTPPGWEQQGNQAERLAALARKLASYNVLLIVGYVPPNLLTAKDSHIQSWVNEYGHLYHLLAQRLFPSYTDMSAQYADDKLPAMVVLRGASTPIMHALAGFVAPYVAVRQSQITGSEAELIGLMDIILDELETDDLSRTEHKRLRSDGVTILRRMLAVPIRQIGLTTFDRPIFFTNPQPALVTPAKLPEQDGVPKPAFDLPRLEDEAGLSEDSQTPTEQLFKTNIPISGERSPKRRLPLPGLPKKPDEG